MAANLKKLHFSRKRQRSGHKRSSGVLLAGLCGIFVIAGVVGNVCIQETEKGKVYAASGEEWDGEVLPSGISGILTSVEENSSGSKVGRLGTSCENMLVGQRVYTVEEETAKIDLGEALLNTAANLNAKSKALVSSAAMMSDADYDTLLRIVEAEAGEDDVKGRVLVANVIMNRVARTDFPNSVTDVVFQYVNGVPQFSPTYDGSIYNVTVTDDTREAVRQALEGADYSEGALFFVQKSAADESNVSWFEKDLKKLFKYGVHEFYTYPENIDMVKSEEAADADSGTKMAKND